MHQAVENRKELLAIALLCNSHDLELLRLRPAFGVGLEALATERGWAASRFRVHEALAAKFGWAAFPSLVGLEALGRTFCIGLEGGFLVRGAAELAAHAPADVAEPAFGHLWRARLLVGIELGQPRNGQ